jgi:hypothetical protein
LRRGGAGQQKMNIPANHLEIFSNPLDRILAEIALSIQLPPSLHRKSRSRFASIRSHLEAQPGFLDQIEWFYPQGFDGDRRDDFDPGNRR